MKPLLLAGALIAISATNCLADGDFWVVGNRATSTCDIVTSNPVINGNIWFGDGPYKSRDDAKLARSTIGACPKQDDPKDEQNQKQADQGDKPPPGAGDLKPATAKEPKAPESQPSEPKSGEPTEAEK